MTQDQAGMLEMDPFAPPARANPYAVYHRLRTTDPVHRSPLGSWLLTRYADVEKVLRDPDRFSSDFANSDRFRAEGEQSRGVLGMARGRVMLFTDPPDHTRLRNLVNKAFTPRAVEAMRPRVREIVDELLDGVEERGREMDVITDLAYPLPVIVICEMLGVPTKDRDTFKGWSRAIAGMLDPISDLKEASRRMDASGPAAMQMFGYFGNLMNERRENPTDDMLSALIAAEQSGDKLEQGELLAMCILLFVAGHETTMNLIGNGTLALLRNPGELERLRDDPSLIRPAVEELLRYDSPVQLTSRTALEDVQIGDKTVRKGQQVTTLLGAANRDPEVFADPDRLDVGRTDNRHVAFGGGPHFCLGAPLARIEGQEVISALLDRFPDMKLAVEQVEWRDTFTLRGLAALPVTLR